MKNNFLSASGLVKVFEKVKNFVKPNPTLVGTEQALTGLEINGIKFKAGGSDQHLYWHTLLLAVNAGPQQAIGTSCYFIILNTSAQQITKEAFFSMLTSDLTAEYVVTQGYFKSYSSGSLDYIPLYAKGVDPEYSTILIQYMKPQVGAQDTFTLGPSQVSSFKDAVTQIF